MQSSARLVSSTCRACGLAFAYDQVGSGRRRRFCEPCTQSGGRRKTINADRARLNGNYDWRAYQRRHYQKRKAAGLHWSAGRKRKMVICIHCGARFETAQLVARVCSKACLTAFQTARQEHLRKSEEQKAATRQDRWNRRRARKANAPIVEQVDLIAIFERDNWTCWICGEPAPRELRGKRDPMAPTGDHVIPLARGGDHTASNIRCAHARCNFRKCDKLPSEIGLTVPSSPCEARF